MSIWYSLSTKSGFDDYFLNIRGLVFGQFSYSFFTVLEKKILEFCKKFHLKPQIQFCLFCG